MKTTKIPTTDWIPLDEFLALTGETMRNIYKYVNQRVFYDGHVIMKKPGGRSWWRGNVKQYYEVLGVPVNEK